MKTLKTITIQIGNTDDKLKQKEWASFVMNMHNAILRNCAAVHFFGGSTTWEQWQNVAWVVECNLDSVAVLKIAVENTRRAYFQDSAAWTEGETIFI